MPTLLGDLNLDAAVSIADFIELASHFAQSNANWFEGDLNYDDQVSIADFITLASNFGQSYSGEMQQAQQPMATAGESVVGGRSKPRAPLPRRRHHHRKPLEWDSVSRRWVHG